MSATPESATPDQPQPKVPMPTGIRVLIGCGLFVVAGGVLSCIGVIGIGFWGKGKLDEFAAPFEENGYERVTAQVAQVVDPVEKPTVYTVQILQIESEVDADLAIMAQVVEIKGTINGDIDFYGQILHVAPQGAVNGDIRVKGAQAIVIDGPLDGEISGDWQTLKRNDLADEMIEAEAEADEAADMPRPAD